MTQLHASPVRGVSLRRQAKAGPIKAPLAVASGRARVAAARTGLPVGEFLGTLTLLERLEGLLQELVEGAPNMCLGRLTQRKGRGRHGRNFQRVSEDLAESHQAKAMGFGAAGSL